VAVHDVGEQDGQHYFSMDYVAGRSLSHLVREDPLPPRRAARYVQAVAEAIHYAHERGILHRDLKPSNVLIDAHDQPRVTDFGLAKRFERPDGSGTIQVTQGDAPSGASSVSASTLTMSGMALGTPSYMPPEQAAARRGDVGPHSDVYALGAILYELLTGRPPFRAPTPMDTLLLVLSAEPVAPRLLNPRIPRDLETIALKCLSKEPWRRYATAQELAEELGRFLADEPIRARPVGRAMRLWRWCRRNPVMAGLLTVVGLLLLAISVASTSFAVRIRAEKDKVQTNLDRAQAADRDATEKLRGSYFSQARAERWSGRAGRRFRALEALSKAAEIQPSLELRNEAIASLALTDIDLRRQWLVEKSGGGSVDAALELYAVADAAGTVRVHRVADQALLAELPGDGTPVPWVMRFSPDGKLLAVKYQQPGFEHPNVLRLWRLADRRALCEPPGGVCTVAVDFSPDGRTMAVGAYDGTFALYDTADGREAARWPSGPMPYSVRYSPDGTRAAVSYEGGVAVRDAATGEVHATFSAPGQVRGIAWNPAGTLLAAGCADNCVRVWDLAAPSAAPRVLPTEHVAASVAFDRRGELLATAGWDLPLRLWDVATGEQLAALPARANPASFSADDRWLGFDMSESHLGLYEVGRGDVCRALRVAAPTVQAPTATWSVELSGDGRVAVTANEDGVRFWDLAAHRPLLHVPGPPLRSAVFLPDGSGLVTSGAEGVFRWPIDQRQDTSGEKWQLGDREPLPGVGNTERLALAPQRRLLVALPRETACPVLVDLDAWQGRPLTEFHANAVFVGANPDGRWVATGTWHGVGVRVWDATTGRPVRDLKVAGNAHVAFSPDGRWLVAATGAEYRFFSVGDWRPAHRIEREYPDGLWGPVAFSADGAVMAYAASHAAVGLAETHTGRELARFEAPQPAAGKWLALSADGSQLVVAVDGRTLHHWDLRLLRQELAAMQLDWPQPAFPPAERAGGPIRIELAP
jgi:WD40 repeat protein